MLWEDNEITSDFNGNYTTLKHKGIVHETVKAILFRKNNDCGFWLPKSLIVQNYENAVTFIDCIVVKEVELKPSDLSDKEWREIKMQELREQMRKLNEANLDCEPSHVLADQLLCEALELLGGNGINKTLESLGTSI